MRVYPSNCNEDLSVNKCVETVESIKNQSLSSATFVTDFLQSLKHYFLMCTMYYEVFNCFSLRCNLLAHIEISPSHEFHQIISFQLSTLASH